MVLLKLRRNASRNQSEKGTRKAEKINSELPKGGDAEISLPELEIFSK